MIVLFETGSIRLMCKHIQLKGNTYYYRRRVPEDVRNLLSQDFEAERPDRKWGADISSPLSLGPMAQQWQLWTSQGWLYLAVVLDLHSRPSPWASDQWRHHGSTSVGQRVTG